MLYHPKEDLVLANILNRKMTELQLIMFGIPKSELNNMSPTEVQVMCHLIAYMQRNKEENYA